MSKQANLDRLAQLHDSDLDAVVEAVERVVTFGDAWLQRDGNGNLRARDNAGVIITERV